MMVWVPSRQLNDLTSGEEVPVFANKPEEGDHVLVDIPSSRITAGGAVCTAQCGKRKSASLADGEGCKVLIET